MDAAAAPAPAPAPVDSNAFLSAVTRYKHHIIASAVILCVASAAYYAVPNFVSVLSYFWPLLLSTALFLAAIVFFGKASTPNLADGAGCEIMEYVAGGPHEMETVGSEGEASTSASKPQRPTL